jgi:calcineurin-like phosphoesterase family protein
MITTLYKPFQKWSDGGSVYVLSDLHFADPDCKMMDAEWITPDEQVEIINSKAGTGDTFLCLGDVGDISYVEKIKAYRKILILGNHDRKGECSGVFDEVYEGPLFISDKILLSHEPIEGLSWCLNIHGHDHNGTEFQSEDCRHLNLAANVCGYTPVNLGQLIKDGILADIVDIHRQAINKASIE